MQLIPSYKNGLYGYMEYGTKKVLVEPMFTKANLYFTHYGSWNRSDDKRMELENKGFPV